ncbi:MAG: UDP-glucose--hexose-1-phosphate uridylyltransferase [Acidobacteria bacterium]|nr:UDP-glucose--hexose-1-phosphate uridylyltransferase [Acidobacteriota bacterium]
METHVFDRPHRRLNPLTGDYVLVSPQRTLRPWQGQIERAAAEVAVAHDPACYLCAGNLRAGGHRNPDYTGTFVFDNDFPALLPKVAGATTASTSVLVAEPENGVCRVVCFSPRHDLSLARMRQADVVAVVETWTDETRRLGARDDIACVQIFENRGQAMGCSNPHPHGQIWATEHLPNETLKELAHQERYFERHKRPLLADVLAEELASGDRIVLENEGFVAFVPFWAAWPFETIVVPRRPLRTLLDLNDDDGGRLADVLRRLTIRYDNLFETSFPYSMGFHQAPFDGRAHPEWTLHLHVYPPLLRGATVRKFMVGFEMLAMPGRDLTPEDAAARLRGLPDVHFQAD